MKIAYCTGSITNSGGVERVLALKTNYLVENGYDISIILIDKNDKEPFFKFNSKIKIYRLDLDFNEHGIRKKINFARNKKLFLNKLGILLDEIKPDITISTYSKYSRYIYELKDNSKKIVEIHFAKYKRPQYMANLDKYAAGRFITNWYKRADYSIVKKFDAFVVLTEEDRALWGDLKNIHYIPNPLTFIPEKISDTSGKRVIAIGRLGKQKRLDLLLKVWSKIAHKYPDWKLVTFGNGKIETLKKLAKDLDISSNVEINPPTAAVDKEMLKSSIYALTSRYEGFGLVITEAMSLGLPAVSFACKCGPSDIIEDGTDGFLVKPGDLDMFAKKLSVLIEDDELRRKMGQTAAKNVLRYSEDKVMKKWTDLFDSLVKTNK